MKSSVSPGLALYLALSERWAPLVERYLAKRLARGKEDPERPGERRGIAGRPRPDGPLIWFHAASVGESLSTLELIRRVGERRPDINVMVTTGTRTSAALMGVRMSKNAFHQYVPVDVRPYIRKFLDHWKPDMAVWTESELWPALVHETSRTGIPMMLLNARMSYASHDRWRWFPGMARSVLGAFDHALAQDEDSARHLRLLGYPRDRIEVTGFLKEGAQVLPHDESERARIAACIGTRPTWFAASTHAGEDEIVLAAHKLALRRTHRLMLILAPRHPERFDDVAALIESQGLRMARRSKGEYPDQDTDVYLADSMGEMGLWYRLAPVSVVCGSLCDRIGGHNPFEPAALGSAILHGPYMFNFSDIYARLAEAKAAIEVATAEELARNVQELLAPDRAAELAKAAWEVSSRGAEVTERAVTTLLEIFDNRGA
jgi:3-deoxy-D-manno-octulosonic-acid transferase